MLEEEVIYCFDFFFYDVNYLIFALHEVA